jgi:hypothetical protein
MSRRVFRQTEFYQTLYRPPGGGLRLTAVLPDPEAGTFLLVSLHRKRLDFTERDRALLNLLLPHVAGVRRRMPTLPSAANGSCWFDDEGGFIDGFGRTPWGLTRRKAMSFWLGQGKPTRRSDVSSASRNAPPDSLLRVYPKMGVENRYTAIVALNRVSCS